MLFGEKMIFSFILPATAIAAVVSAHSPAIESRQSWTGGWWGQEFLTYGCRAPVIFVFAKATLEPGNLVSYRGAPSIIESLNSMTQWLIYTITGTS